MSSRPARLVVIAALTVAALAAARLASAQPSFEMLTTLPAIPGAGPSGLIQATDGNFYGATSYGGAVNVGTLFRMTASGGVTFLYEFTGGADGSYPYDGLIQAADGNFYGAATEGGSAHLGTLFRMTPSGSFTLLHTFVGGSADGAFPHGGLIQADDGNFYGTTTYGGAANLGTVFRMTPAGSVTVLHAFQGGSDDGAAPFVRVIQGTDGNLYGTTVGGGGTIDSLVSTRGTIFKLTLGGVVTILYRFSYPTTSCDAEIPSAALIQATDGSFYGIANAFGPCARSYVFKLTQGGTFTPFGILPGSAPEFARALIQGSDGNLYGTFVNSFGEGRTAFAFTLGGGLSFQQSIPGNQEMGLSSLIQASDGHFYGTTAEGIVYRLVGPTPLFYTQPADLRVRTGLSAIFRAAAVSTPSPTFQWQVSATGGAQWMDLANNSTYSGVTSTTLVVTASLDLSGNQYRAVASNGHGSPTSNVATLTVSDFLVVDGDVDGDGKGDLLWRNSQTGDVVVWVMDGPVPTHGPVVGAGVPLAWQIVGTGDLDGDGRVDLVWRHSQTGDVAVWLMNGRTVKQAPVVAAAVPLAWQIAGVGDLDGDGKADLVWRHTTTGDVAVWLMNGATVTQGPVVAAGVPLAWQIAGIGDLDADGKADLVWRHTTTGDVAAWLMNGTTIRQGPVVAAGVPLTWQIAGVGDYDGDGNTDLVWRHTTTGDVAVWMMNGATVKQAPVVVVGVPLSWQLSVLRDVDGDGRTDLVWHNATTGDVSVSVISGVVGRYTAGVAFGVPLDWQLQR